jgi:hypothetical protein
LTRLEIDFCKERWQGEIPATFFVGPMIRDLVLRIVLVELERQDGFGQE